MKKALLIIVSFLTVTIFTLFLTWYFMCKQVVGFTVTTLPNKTSYYVNEEFDLDGISFTAYKRFAKFNEEISLEEVEISGFDSSKPNDELTITVTYKSFKDEFNVSVKDLPPSKKIVSNLYVVGLNGNQPKTEYCLYEILDVLNMRLHVYYTDGSDELLEIASLVDDRIVINEGIKITGFDNREVAKDLEVKFIYQNHYDSIYVNIKECGN